jgi:hypothetical protein
VVQFSDIVKCPYGLWDCSVCAGGCNPGAKAAGTWTSPPSSAEFRMLGAYLHRPELPHNVHREILVLLYVMRNWQLLMLSKNFFWCKYTFDSDQMDEYQRNGRTSPRCISGKETKRFKLTDNAMISWHVSALKMRVQWRRNVVGEIQVRNVPTYLCGWRLTFTRS